MTKYILPPLLLSATEHVRITVAPWDDVGPTKSPLSVPPATIVYATPHSNTLTVTVAIPLVIGAVPDNNNHVHNTNCTCTCEW